MDRPPNKPLLPFEFSNILAAVIGVVASTAFWVGQQAIHLDARIDQLESDRNQLMDRNGNPRASVVAIELQSRMAAIEAKLEDLAERLR